VIPRFLDAATATWEEAKAYLARYPAAILPLGATEQHGPHLPQNTDTILAGEVCRRVAEQSIGYLLPPIPITYSWVWRNFPGSPWLRTETFVLSVKDIVRSLERGGVRGMLILTGHGANQAPLKYAVRELADESKVAILHGAPMAWPRSPQRWRAASGSGPTSSTRRNWKPRSCWPCGLIWCAWIGR